MITIATDANNDIFVGADGNLAFSRDAQAVSQTAEHYAKTLFNEMIQDFDSGVPFFIVAFGSSPSIPQFEAAMKARILQTPGVTGIRSFETLQDGDILKYTAFIETVYGGAVING